jgi:hypothetical protein
MPSLVQAHNQVRVRVQVQMLVLGWGSGVEECQGEMG